MNPSITISVSEVAGTPICVASGDGQRVFEQISRALNAGQTVNLSFVNVTHLTTAFLNAAIGQLYSSFEEDKIRSHIKVSEVQMSNLGLLIAVVNTAT